MSRSETFIFIGSPPPEVDEALTKMRKIQLKLEAAEKENQILEITLRQRDAEVNRLRELTR